MPNNALLVNAGVTDRNGDLQITDRGSDWYWAVCAVMTVSTFAFIGLATRVPRARRLFHYITAMITLVAAIAYFSMAAGIGQTPITVEFSRPGSSMVSGASPGGLPGTREIFYVRYIDWFVTTPLLLLDLLLTAGMPWPTILVTLIADEVMIITGLVGALTSSSYKWGYWTFGMIAFFYVVYSVGMDGRKHASALGPDVSRTFTMCGVLTLSLWFLYPIAWGLSEGGNVIHPDGEAVFYGILDVLAKPGFGFLLIFGHRNIDPAVLGLHIVDYEGKGATRTEKGVHTGATNGSSGVTNGHNTATTTTSTNHGTTELSGNHPGTATV